MKNLKMNDFNKNFLRLLKVKNLDDKRVQALDKKADRNVKITETKTQRYNNLKYWKQSKTDILGYHEKDIEKLKEELKRKEKFYNDIKKDIEKYDEEISNLLSK